MEVDSCERFGESSHTFRKAAAQELTATGTVKPLAKNALQMVHINMSEKGMHVTECLYNTKTSVLEYKSRLSKRTIIL